jgi:hypothetical protein
MAVLVVVSSCAGSSDGSGRGTVCSSQAIDIAVTAPEEWMCQDLGGTPGPIEGVRIIEPAGDLKINLRSPAPFGRPCEFLGLCGDVRPIDLGTNFPSTEILRVGDSLTVYGRSSDAGVELLITSSTPLSDSDVSVIKDVLASIGPAPAKGPGGD